MVDNNSVQIVTGEKHISIEKDGAKVGEIVFDPDDILFAQKFYRLYANITGKQNEYQQKAEQVEKVDALDDHGVPINAADRFALLVEVCDYMRMQIDTLFGDGTCKMVFGETQKIELFVQFMNGMKKYIQPSRDKKIERYVNPAARPKRAKHTKNG